MNQGLHKKIFSLSFLIVLLFGLFIFLPEIGLAEGDAIDNFELQVPIPGGNKMDIKSGKAIGEYISGIYNYATGVVGILAAIIMMFGGVRWITAGGNAEAVGEAKKWIGGALSGMVLVTCSYLILYTVNPDLTVFKKIEIKNCGTENCNSAEKCEISKTNGDPKYKCIPISDSNEATSNCLPSPSDIAEIQEQFCNAQCNQFGLRNYNVSTDNSEICCECHTIETGCSNQFINQQNCSQPIVNNTQQVCELTPCCEWNGNTCIGINPQ